MICILDFIRASNVSLFDESNIILWGIDRLFLDVSVYTVTLIPSAYDHILSTFVQHVVQILHKNAV